MKKFLFLIAACLLSLATSIGSAQNSASSPAIQIFMEKANAGDAEAMNMLGNFYAYGQGTPKDLNEAKKWYEAAAKKGNPSGNFNLGLMYEKGEIVTKNTNKALEYFKLAATGGSAAAKKKLSALETNPLDSSTTRNQITSTSPTTTPATTQAPQPAPAPVSHSPVKIQLPGDWKLIESSENGYIFINMSSVTRKGNVVNYSWLVSTKAPISTNGNKFQSTGNTSIMDCQKQMFSNVTGTVYSGPGGGGEIIWNGLRKSSFDQIERGSTEETIYSMICR